jgi:hypothetical protein
LCCVWPLGKFELDTRGKNSKNSPLPLQNKYLDTKPEMKVSPALFLIFIIKKKKEEEEKKSFFRREGGGVWGCE